MRFQLHPSDIQAYRLAEDLTEPLIYAMVVFSPWAFGTSEPWSIRIMNGAGYALGALLALKLAIRWLKGYCPPRWDESWLTGRPGGPRLRVLAARSLTTALAGLTVAILGYCLVSAWNARATYVPVQLSFAYHDCIRWLPHSLDSVRSWEAFWNYLALAGAFWAIRDWLLGKTEVEQGAEGRSQTSEVRHQKSEVRSQEPALTSDVRPLTSNPSFQPSAFSSSPVVPSSGFQVSGFIPPPSSLPFSGFRFHPSSFPCRLRRLLWLLAINGALLGIEGIVQRLEGSGELLFLVKPRVNPNAVTQFGPYAYRANAAQYFNLVWPLVLGFWWTLQAAGRRAHSGRHVLLFCAAIMAACPIISTSRGGAIVTAGIIVLLLLAAGYQLWQRRGTASGAARPGSPLMLVLFAVVALGLGYGLGWKALKPRMAQLSENAALREQMYEAARPMADDYPIYGTGPGTFEPIFQLYRLSVHVFWPAQLHNDWLETRITFGLAGSALIGLALALVLGRWSARGGIGADGPFMVTLWLAAGGCLLHARYDFPFQMYSILFVFLILCAILSTVTRRGAQS